MKNVENDVMDEPNDPKRSEPISAKLKDVSSELSNIKESVMG
jgi:hypothetical protein